MKDTIEKYDVLPIRGVVTHSFGTKIALLGIFGTVTILFVALLGVQGLMVVNKFFDEHYFATHKMIEVKIQSPLSIETRALPESPVVLTAMPKEETRTDKEIEELIQSSKNPEVAKKVIETFGVVHGPKALAIFTAESGLNCEAIGVNTNRTVDLGVAQINSIHFNKDFTAKDAFDCNKAIEWAEAKAKRDAKAGEKYNFSAWVAYSTGRFLAFYK